MEKQKLIWGSPLRTGKSKLVCRPAMIFHWLLLWKWVLELFWTDIGSLFSVPSHLWCVENQVLGRNQFTAGPTLAPVAALGPKGPYKDEASLSSSLPNGLGLTAHFSCHWSFPLYLALHFFSLQGYWERRLRASLLNSSLGNNIPYYAWCTEQGSFVCIVSFNTHQKTW